MILSFHGAGDTMMTFLTEKKSPTCYYFTLSDNHLINTNPLWRLKCCICSAEQEIETFKAQSNIRLIKTSNLINNVL